MGSHAGTSVTILTNALTGGHMGTYLGLFNGTICVPQIVAAVARRMDLENVYYRGKYSS